MDWAGYHNIIIHNIHYFTMLETIFPDINNNIHAKKYRLFQ